MEDRSRSLASCARWRISREQVLQGLACFIHWTAEREKRVQGVLCEEMRSWVRSKSPSPREQQDRQRTRRWRRRHEPPVTRLENSEGKVLRAENANRRNVMKLRNGESLPSFTRSARRPRESFKFRGNDLYLLCDSCLGG